MTRAQTTSTTQQNTGGAVAPSVAGKNAVINGGFDIWQRGTSITMSSTAYGADRWSAYSTFSGGTVSRQTTSDTTNLPFIQYCARVQRDSGSTNLNTRYLYQSIETVNSIPMVGKTVTLSFYARAGTNYSPTSSLMEVKLATGTGTDQNWAAYTSLAYAINTTVTLTTTWQRFTVTTASTIGTTVTELAVAFGATPTGTASTNDYFEVTGVQLEVGSVATPFARAGGTIQGELAACQRYYQRISQATSTRFLSGVMTATGTTNLQGSFPLSTSMRTTPSVADYANVSASADNISTALTVSSVTLSGFSENGNLVIMNAAVTGATQYRSYLLYGNTTNAYIGFGAEL